MRMFRALMVLTVAVSLMASTIGCGKPNDRGRRSAGSAQGTGGTETPQPDGE